MAISANTIWEVASTGTDGNAGADTNGGGFNPTNANMPTDLTTDANTANTASPVVSSVTYSFVAGDVNQWLFIKSGTNWIPGWYKITAVSSNKATLSAAIGAAILYATGGPYSVSTATGCATVGTPTAGTFAIDYSQSGTAKAAITNAVTAGTTTITSVSNPFHKAMVGNMIYVTGGTGAIAAAWYEIVSDTGVGTIVVDRSTGLTAGTGATLNVGGCLSSPGQASSNSVGGSRIYLKNATYSITSASSNVTGGCMTLPSAAGGASSGGIFGYASLRTDAPTGSTRPLIQASGISTFTLIILTNQVSLNNIIVDGASLTSSKGIGSSGSSGGFHAYRVTVKNCNNGGFHTVYAHECDATGCATIGAFRNCPIADNCVAWSNTFTGFEAFTGVSSHWINCLSVNNTGASSHGFDGLTSGGNNTVALNCTAFGNGGAGFLCTARTAEAWFENCISYGNTGNGFDTNASTGMCWMINCAAGNNAVNVNTNIGLASQIGTITLTATPFTSSGGADFSLNNTSGGGAACRAHGITGALPGISTTAYIDLGAVQHADPAMMLYTPGMAGGMEG